MRNEIMRFPVVAYLSGLDMGHCVKSAAGEMAGTN
jgi:hypothetical protein